MSIFQKSVINQHLLSLDNEELEKVYKKFQAKYTRIKIEKIKKLKEEEYQDGFLRDIFVSVLNYVLKPDDNYNLVREFKNQTDGKKADGAILKDGKAIAVVELKSTKTKDLKSVTEQAFNYKNNQPDCKYVITSNFRKLRFYVEYANEYEEFDLFNLNKEKFELLYLVLSKDNLFADIPIKIKNQSTAHSENISKKLYKQYSVFKNNLFNNLVKNNPEHDKLELFKKSQKLIDRFLFILFAEDRGLLPPNSIKRIIERFNILKREDAYKPIYDIYKQYFNYMNIGRKGEDYINNIPAYNGGLFYPDELLDNLVIDNDILIDDLTGLSVYDFSTEVDVNILGHIFEHSLSEIEEVTAKIKGINTDKTKSKRKKDGVFYTPKYITQYIVENTIGCLCEEKRKELNLSDIELDKTYYTKSGQLSKKGTKFNENLDKYKNWLLSLKIIDPACGSGAFLNQALNFLIDEHNFIIEIQADLEQGQFSLFDVETTVLENNLYGVDINEESVEIAKLSLWLRTAKRDRKLSVLSDNIKCGNSLIDDPEIAGNKAFNWQEEFSDVFAQGGFDIVIGNPPYVRQELLSPYKSYLEKNYQTYSGTTDLFSYFYEKSLILLKKSGYLGFISNTFAKTTGAGIKLRHFLKHNSKFLSIADFSDQKIFEGITTYPIIPILKKEKSSGQFNYLKVKEEDLLKLSSAIEQNSILVDQSLLKDEFWSFESKAERQLKDKILKHRTVKDVFGKCYYGIKTGFNEAFIISDDKRKEIIANNPKEAEIIKPYLEGKDLKKWGCFDASKWLILFSKGWTSLKSGFKKEEDAWEFIKSNYPIISSHLADYKEKASKRYDKGEFWWELRACGYYNLFETPKVVWPNLQSENKFSFDSKGFYINAPSVILPTDSKALLCIINSKLAWFFFKNICVIRNGGYLEMKPQYFEQLPVSLPSDEKPFNEKADMMLAQNKALHEFKADFLNFLESELKPKKITKKLESWDELGLEQFKKELTKCKVKFKSLSLKERKEWQEYFSEQKQKADEIKAIIDSTHKEIDQMVYKLYGLIQEEIKIIENAP